MSNVHSKIMISTLLNSFAGEKYPASQVNRTLRAIENVEDTFATRDSKNNNMKQLAKYMAAELGGAVETPEETTHVVDQEAINAKIFASLDKITTKLGI